jgi:hypothetical protein
MEASNRDVQGTRCVSHVDGVDLAILDLQEETVVAQVPSRTDL